MQIKIQDKSVRIYETGIKLLKLKSDISFRIGALAVSGKDYVSFPVSALLAVKDLLSEIDSEIENHLEKFQRHEMARTGALSIIENESVLDFPDYWRNILEPAQLTATAAMAVHGLLGLCLFDEQGSGKTIMTIASFDILKNRDEVDAMIVACPKTMVSEWIKDIGRFCPSKYTIVTSEGSQKQRYDAALKDFDVLVTNYEGIKSMLGPLMASASSRRFLLVIDESYYLKNSEAARSEHALQLRERCRRCFVLCGTPAPNTAHDLINQFNLADLGFTFGAFKKSKNPEQDWDKIASLIESKGLFIRRLKTDILKHVPEKKFHVLRVTLSGKQKMMYESARSELELELRNLNNETFKKKLLSYFQKRAALLQICSCPGAIDPTVSETPAKYQVLDQLLQDLIKQGRKVVVWSFYTKSLDEIEDRYMQYHPVRISGATPVDQRRKAVQRFQEDSKTMLFVGNPSAAGAGVTLHSSYDAVYLSYSNQAAHYLQSLDRIHRRGQVSDEVNYYLLICKDTIEETEIIKLRGKEIRQHKLLGDHISWPASLDDALEELKSP